MTAAHTAALRLLYHSLDRLDDVVLRRGVTAPDEYGDVEFASRTVTADKKLEFEEWVATVAHELVHLGRGPAWTDEADIEEARVAEATARLLVPREVLPPILEAARPEQIAFEQQIDVPTVQLAIALARQERDDDARTDSEEGIA